MKWCFIIMVSLALLGCSSKQSQFYVLNTDFYSPLATSSLKIGLGPIKVAEYLKRPQIMTRVDENELKVHEFHRWAEGLQNNITWILAQNLENDLSGSQVVPYPWPRYFNPDYQVAVNIMQFDAKLNCDVILTYQALITDLKSNHVYGGNIQTIVVPFKGTSFDVMAETMSNAMIKLSHAIAMDLLPMNTKADIQHLGVME